MPIDSQCTGCGKSLRVSDEFVGRKARCPVCGIVYIVGGVGGVGLDETTPAPIASDHTAFEATYLTQNDSSVSTLQPLADSGSSLATDNPIAPIAKFFVRTPNSIVYGPSDAKTVLEWINQGRLDDTCHIREQSSEQWLGIAAWRFQSRSIQNPVASSVYQGTYQFGSVPVSTVQSAGYGKAGNGTVVLVLGLISWVLCPTVLGAWICSILAIVFAIIEFKQIRDGQSPSSQKTFVLIGMWLAIANLVAWAFLTIGVIVIAILSP